MTTVLSELIDKQVQQSIMLHLARTTDTVAEEMAHDLLRDDAFRDAMRELVRAAFNKALAQLQEPPPTAT